MLEDLLNASSHYPRDRYEPDPRAVGELGIALKGSLLVIFTGQWCRDCNDAMPKLVAILSSVKPEPNVELVEIERGPFTHPEMKRWSVMAIPTVLVVRDGREVGRIVEYPEGSWESNLLKVAIQ